jgi:hypothetical protein
MTDMTRAGKASWLIFGLAGSFILLRIMLWFSPNSDFDLLGYNIHHLFTGLVIISLTAPLIILEAGGRQLMKYWLLAFGAGLGMALDEWVYLIVTDGSNDSYLLPVSFWGGAAAVALAVFWIVIVLKSSRKG